MDDRDRDLADAVDELAETLEALRAELREPPRGPLGLPRPPSPGEFLRITEQYTIPALVSLLEASVRVLELLAAAIRIADGRPLEGRTDSRPGIGGDATGSIAAVSRETLERLDDALAELQSAASDGESSNPEVRRLLSDARTLREEVDERLADATASDAGGGPETEPTHIEVRSGETNAETDHEESGGPGDTTTDDEDGGDVGVDVDRELESIKRELDDGSADESGSDDDRGDDEDSTTHNGS